MARSESLVFLTQYYAPEEIGSAPYCVDLARWLVERGFAVKLVTGQPHYPSPELYGAFHRAGIRQEQDGGIEVTRLKAMGPKDRSVRQRILSELAFFARGIAALATGRIERNKLVLSLSPSIFCVALGVLMRRRGGRHVALIHDIQSGLAGGLGMVRSSLMLKAMRMVERIVLNRVDAIAVLTPEMAASLKALGVSRPIEVVPLWVDTDAIVPMPERDPPSVLYSGNLGRKQGLEQVIRLARDLQDRAPEVRILVRGGGNQAPELHAAIESQGLRNVQIEALLPKAELNRGLAEGAVHLVPQNPQAADFAMPSKIFNIMAAGRPFVATAGPGSALWRVQRQSQAFVCVLPDDAELLVDSVLGLLQDDAKRRELGAAGRCYVEINYGRSRVLSQFSRLLEGVSEAVESAESGIVVLEPSHEGHPQEWLEHIVRFASTERISEPLRLVVAPQLHDRLAALVPADAADRIQVAPLTAREQALCLHRSLAVSGFARWWIMRRYLKRYRAGRGHFLSLDHLSLPLALGFGAMGRKLDGILFRPSVHYHQMGSYTPDWRERVRDLRKSVLYRFMLLNRSVESVLTLDPFFARYALASYRGGVKVRAVPDPAQWSGVEIRERPIVGEKGRVRFLMFGYLAERKGVLALLTAIAHLPPAIASQVSLVIAGSVDPDIRDRLRHAINDLLVLQPTVRLAFKEGRLSDTDLKLEIDRCDVILAPYQRFVGSSGVLIWAASAGKPVLTQDFGLLHRLASDYRLGLTTDTCDPRRLAETIERMVVEGPTRHFDATLAAQFIRERSPRSFAAGILNSPA